MANIQEPEQTNKNEPLHSGISVDSLKVRIPKALVEIIEPSLTTRWILINEATGEIDPDTFKQNALTRYIDKAETVKIRFGLEKQRTEHKTVEEFLTILLPSKALCSRYFEGFTLGNIEEVYTKLMEMDIVFFSLDTFLNHSFCTDVDFKRDFICTDMDKLVSRLATNATPSKVRGDGIRAFKQGDNKGIEFNERKTPRYKSNPFLKVYHKQIEITTPKNLKFHNTYLKGIPIDNLCRIEATVKNKAHFRHLAIDNTSLQNILSLTDEQKENIIGKAVQCNLEPRVQPIRTPKNMSINKLIIYNSIHMLIQQGLAYDLIKRHMLTGVSDKTNRYRKSRELDEIYSENIQGQKMDIEAKELSRIYDLIGWR
jgi:hypothetical protein